MRVGRFAAVLACGIAIASIAVGAEPSAEETPRAPAPSVDVSAVDASAPVAVPEPGEKAMRYYRSGNMLWVVNVTWGFALYGAFLFTGFSARIRDWARTAGGNRYVTLVIYGAIYITIVSALQLPLSFYQGYLRPHAYDLSNMTVAKFFSDYAKEVGITVVFWSMFLWIPYLLLEKSPRRWWLYSGLAAVPVIVFVILVSPIWVAPWFYDFGPMQDKALEAEVLQVAERAGVDGGRVFEVKLSVNSKQITAYVTGFLNTKRIVLADTLIDKMTDDEVRFVVGHEAGHYALGHVIRWVVLLSALAIGGLWLAHRLSASVLRRFAARFGFDRLSDVASLPLILLMFDLFMLVAMPVTLAYGRHMEHEADRFGLEITQDNRAAATAFVKLQQENLGNPRPGLLYKLWRSSHPTLGDRIDFANTYRPWETGAPLIYADHFQD